MDNLLIKIIKKFPRFFSIFGFNDLKPDILDDRDDVMGQAEPRFEWEVLREDGDCKEEYLDTDLEIQNWMDCTGHGMKNILQILYLVKFGTKISISAAYINGMAKTSKYRGNSLKNVLEAVRKYGWVTDEEWPEENRWKTIPQSVIDKGQNRLKEYDFGYDLVASTKKGLDTGCKFSPLYGGGAAWAKRRNGLYYTFGRANHAFILLANIVKRLAGDSYYPHVKQLAEDYQFIWARRIYLGKKESVYNQEELKRLIDKGTKYVVRPEKNGELYHIKDGKLIHEPDLTKIAIDLADNFKNSPDLVKDVLKFLTQKGQILWATENYYYNKLRK